MARKKPVGGHAVLSEAALEAAFAAFDSATLGVRDLYATLEPQLAWIPELQKLETTLIRGSGADAARALDLYVKKVGQLIDEPFRDPTYGWVVVRAALLAEVIAAPRLHAAGRVADALALRARILPQVPRWYPHVAQRVLVCMAEELADLGRHEEAHRFAQRARAYDPANGWALAELGRAALGLGRDDEARAIATELARRKTPDEDFPANLRALAASGSDAPLPHAEATQFSEREYFQCITYADDDRRLHPTLRLRQHATALRLRGHAARALEVAREAAHPGPRDSVATFVDGERTAAYQATFGPWTEALQRPWQDAFIRVLEEEARDAPASRIAYVAGEPASLARIKAATKKRDVDTLVEAFSFWPGGRVRSASAASLAKIGDRSALPVLQLVAGFEDECGRTGTTPNVTEAVEVLKSSGYPDASSRGAPLVARAIDACREQGLYSAGGKRVRPKPMAREAIAALRLPGDRPLSPAIAEWLAFDAGRFGWSKGFPHRHLADLVPDEYREDLAVPKWLNGACLPLFGSLDYDAFLHVGEPDDLGEYPVLSIAEEDDDLIVFLRTPSFDVYLAESFGVLDFGPSPSTRRDWSAAASEVAKRNLRGKLSVSLLRANR